MNAGVFFGRLDTDLVNAAPEIRPDVVYLLQLNIAGQGSTRLKLTSCGGLHLSHCAFASIMPCPQGRVHSRRISLENTPRQRNWTTVHCASGESSQNPAALIEFNAYPVATTISYVITDSMVVNLPDADQK